MNRDGLQRPPQYPYRPLVRRNAVIVPATLLDYQTQVQGLANMLPAGSTVVVLTPRHQAVLQALTTEAGRERRTRGRC